MAIAPLEIPHKKSFYEKIFEVENYINGEFEERVKTINSYNPALDRVNALIPDSTAADVNRAVSAAKNAFERYLTMIT